MHPARASFHAGALAPREHGYISNVITRRESRNSQERGRTSADDLLALIVCPKAAKGIAHLSHPCSSNAIKEAANTCTIWWIVIIMNLSRENKCVGCGSKPVRGQWGGTGEGPYPRCARSSSWIVSSACRPRPAAALW
jgi:hypothetical protein